jgi:putative membrane protein
MKSRFASVPTIVSSLFLVLSCTSDVPYGPPSPGGWGGMTRYGFHNSFGGIVMWIMYLIVVVLLIYIVLHIGSSKPHNDTPLDILKKRYARGDIAKEEYERMRKDLET